MDEHDLCPNCGTPVVQSIRGSLDTFVAGYVVCWKCRTRINLEAEKAEKEGTESDAGH